jgi:hypothetical protein
MYYTSKVGDAKWASKAKLIKTLADNMGSPSVIGGFNTTQAWGKTGAFVTSADPRGFKATIPFSASNPVIPFTHKSGGTIHAELVPVADNNANGGLAIQLK